MAAIPNGSTADRPPTISAQIRRWSPYIGTYYARAQSLVTVWRALEELRRSGGVVPRIRWVGELPEAARAELAACGLEDLVDVTGRTPTR